MNNILTHDEQEANRKERDRSTGLRSLLAADLCQMCGSEAGTGGTVPWYDGDERHEELCPYCHDVEGV